MAIPVDTPDFLDLREKFPVFDVRTPGEFAKGHIPGAINLPLFTNDERAIVGTSYKREGREPAMLLGLDFVGKKMRSLVENVKNSTTEKTVLVHCWRGGMRSGSVAWLLEFFGYKVYLLRRGYKAYRNFCLNEFSRPRKIFVLGGKTGSGKTKILAELKNFGENIIDLENLARHSGSAFGWLLYENQPTQEQFENELALDLKKISPEENLWLEDESQRIGAVNIPHELWKQMRSSPIIFAEIPLEFRVQNLVEDYAHCPPERLADSINRLTDRLGGERKKIAIQQLEEKNFPAVAETLLSYYDKSYVDALSRREQKFLHRIELNSGSAIENAKALKEFSEQIFAEEKISF